MTTKSTRNAGTASSLIACEGALRAAAASAGGVAGSVSENAASANDAMPATQKMLRSAASQLGAGLAGEEEDERPARGDPADGAPQPDAAELALRARSDGTRSSW